MSESPDPDGRPLLTIDDLVVGFTGPNGSTDVVKGVSLRVGRGETVAIVGESGSGKSTMAMSVIRLLAANGRIRAGSIRFEDTDLTTKSEAELRSVRGRLIGLVPQDPMSNLNPSMKVGAQVAETLLTHGAATKRDVRRKTHDALAAAGIPEPEHRAAQYPHELSGGLRQRVLVAIGLACRPKLLIADEPTSALDVTVQRMILDQIDRMTAEIGTSVLLITHDLALAAERAERIIVMNKGEIVEQGPTGEVLADPRHRYTKALIEAAPTIAAARAVSGHAAHGERNDGEPNLVEVREATKIYRPRGRRKEIRAAVGVSFEIPRGKTVAVVGESGSGKTTTSRMLLRLIEPSSGSISFEGQDIAAMGKAQLARFRQRVQPVFQDPYSSLNPMYTIGRIIEEPLAFYKRGEKKERRTRVLELLEQVALPSDVVDRSPAELSGGQRQRVAIARAIALNPDLIVCDEPVSALDVMVQAQILRLLDRLQAELGLSFLFISHDLAVVRLIADYVCVMKDGEIVESDTNDEIFGNPRHPYTRKLLGSIPGHELFQPASDN
ncbi:dipeptide ABC transporter ATP-binding protein [Saccharopolyspora sp. NPDC000995]